MTTSANLASNSLASAVAAAGKKNKNSNSSQLKTEMEEKTKQENDESKEPQKNQKKEDHSDPQVEGTNVVAGQKQQPRQQQKQQESAPENDDHLQQQQQQQKSSPSSATAALLFSERTPRDRALSLRSLFARLCIPVPKLSFDRERRRGWRFVVMPDCFAWALTTFAPFALLNYQSMEFPTNHRKEQQKKDDDERGGAVKKEKNSKTSAKPEKEESKDDTTTNETKQNVSGPISFCHPPTIDDVASHLWQALANVDGALDQVTGGATLAGFILASTTLLNGLISKQVADSIWNEAFTNIEEKFPRTVNGVSSSSSTSTALVPVAAGKISSNNNKSQLPKNFYNYTSPNFPSPPPICQCFNGAIAADYFSVRESTFIKRLKTYRHIVKRRVLMAKNSNRRDGVGGGGGGVDAGAAASSSYATGFRGSLLPAAAIKSYFMRNVAKRPFDALPQGDDQEWNKCFFSESFHEPHQILSRVSAKFLPPLSSALILIGNGSSGGSKNHVTTTTHGDLLKNGAAAAVVTGEQGASVKRMRDTFLREGSKNAALVRLRLEERIERGQFMQDRMQ